MEVPFNISENDSFDPTYRNLRFSHFYWSSGDSGAGFENYIARKNSEWGPMLLVPLIATLILAVTVFLLVIFRQNPTFVISIVTGCVIFIAVYLILYALDTSKQVLM